VLLEPSLPPAKRRADDEPHAGNLRQEGRRRLQGAQVKTKKNKKEPKDKNKRKKAKAKFLLLFFLRW
jgi:hypothetical protein